MSNRRGSFWPFARPVGLCRGARDRVTQQTVTRCLERAAELGVIAALDDRPRARRDPVITAEAKTWLVALACRKARELGYPHELWTTRLLAAHARQHGPAAGHPSLGKLAQGTVRKILAEQEVKPHKLRYYLEQRDPKFQPKMAEILCVYRQVAMLRAEGENTQGQDGAGGDLAIVSYDEKPGIQAVGTTAPDRPPLPSTSPTVMRDHEYKCHGTLTLMAGIDLLTGQFTPSSRNTTNSSNFSSFSTPPTSDTAIEIILDNHSAHVSRETWAEWRRSALVASAAPAPPATGRRAPAQPSGAGTQATALVLPIVDSSNPNSPASKKPGLLTGFLEALWKALRRVDPCGVHKGGVNFVSTESMLVEACLVNPSAQR